MKHFYISLISLLLVLSAIHVFLWLNASDYAQSVLNDSKEELKKLSKRMLKINTYIIYPLLIGLAVTSKQVVILLYNEKWLNAVPFIQIFCVIRLMLPINTININ